MKRTLFFLVLLGSINLIYAQDSKQIKEAFLDGEYFLAYESYIDALSFYQKVYDQNNQNANINYKIGLCYLNIQNKKDKAIPYLEKATSNTTNAYKEGNFKEEKAPNDAYFYLANAYQIQNRFSEAVRTYNKYLTYLEASDTANINFVNQQIDACKIAVDMIQHPVYFNKKNMGRKINTKSNDFDSVTSGDGNSIVFVSNLKFYDALFYARKKNGIWSTPVNITPDIKSDGDYYPTGMSFDGTKLLLTWNDKFNSDLFESKLVDGKWTPAQKLSKQINTKFWESHGSFSPDDQVLYFTSNRTGGYGGLDIYKSTFNSATQTWGSAVNLGPVINTQFNEETPFICKNNKTLYFASQGHKTMGGFDIFSSDLQESGNWSEPENLGYPLNTADDNMFFLPIENGIKGLLAMTGEKDNFGKQDIYMVEIYSDRNPRPVEITGKVTLSGTAPSENKDIKIDLQKPGGGSPVTLAPNETSGVFSTIQKAPGTYQVAIHSKGYEAQNQTITLPADYSVGQLVVNANLKKVEVTIKPVVLPIVYFDLSSSYLSSAGKTKIKEIARIMNENPDLQIEIAGYTDNTGPTLFNKWLSKRRAVSTEKYLIKLGIAKNRIVSRGYGPSHFIAINQNPDKTDSPEGRKFNRRAEIHIISTSNNAIISEIPDIPANLKFQK